MLLSVSSPLLHAYLMDVLHTPHLWYLFSACVAHHVTMSQCQCCKKNTILNFKTTRCNVPSQFRPPINALTVSGALFHLGGKIWNQLVIDSMRHSPRVQLPALRMSVFWVTCGCRTGEHHRYQQLPIKGLSTNPTSDKHKGWAPSWWNLFVNLLQFSLSPV